MRLRDNVYLIKIKKIIIMIPSKIQLCRLRTYFKNKEEKPTHKSEN